MMKVALLHDYLNQLGGAERVLETFLEMFPEADLYTLLYDKERMRSLFQDKIKKTSFLDFKYVRKRHRPFIPLMPLASRFVKNKENYDLVISSTTGYAKGFNIKNSYHICYCHTVLPYAWEDEYLKTLPFVPKIFLKPARLAASFLKHWDKKTAGKVDYFIANSNFIAQKIKNFYGREAKVIYPPVDEKIFSFKPVKPQEEYYLMAGRFVFYKRFDLGISAFNKLRKKLKIVGEGFAVSNLQKIADPKYIEFIPFVPKEELVSLYLNARAFIFPQIEHFGLVAAEAQMCGLPVIAYGKGGALEIVEEDKTGLFFQEQTPEDIIEAVKRFENMNFNRNYIARSARRFSKESFKAKIKDIYDRRISSP